MFDIAELQRKLKNMVRVTKVVTPNKDGKSLATVKVGNDESAEFVVMSFANSFKKHWIPIRKDEQVLVLFPFGNANRGFVFRGIFHKSLREPSGADKDTEVMEYSDGARVSYSVKSGELRVSGVKVVVVESADAITLKSAIIKLDGEVEVTKSLKVAQTISDAKGDLTGHAHEVVQHKLAKPRP